VRGGYESFLEVPLVTRSVTWADLQTATALGRKPIFPLVYGESLAALPPDALEAAELPSLEHVAAMGPGGARVKHAFVLLRRAIIARSKPLGQEAVRLHMHIAESAILRLLFDEDDRRLLLGLLRPLLLAAHLYLYVAMRQVPKRGAVVRALVGRLTDSLRPGRADPVPMLLPATTCRAMTIQPGSKGVLKDMLGSFLWHDKYCSSFLDDFWESSVAGCAGQIGN